MKKIKNLLLLGIAALSLSGCEGFFGDGDEEKYTLTLKWTIDGVEQTDTSVLGGAGSYEAQIHVDLICPIMPGYHFDGWYDGDTLLSAYPEREGGNYKFWWNMNDRDTILEARYSIAVSDFYYAYSYKQPVKEPGVGYTHNYVSTEIVDETKFPKNITVNDLHGSDYVLPEPNLPGDYLIFDGWKDRLGNPIPKITPDLITSSSECTQEIIANYKFKTFGITINGLNADNTTLTISLYHDIDVSTIEPEGVYEYASTIEFELNSTASSTPNVYVDGQNYGWHDYVDITKDTVLTVVYN